MPDFRIQGEPPQGVVPSPEEVVTHDSLVTCPRCYQSTESLKCYHVPNVVFLLAYFVWNYDRIVGCPSCIRSSVFKRCLIAIPLTNILFPLFALNYLRQFIASFRRGHSDSAVADAHRMSRADLMANLPQVLSLHKTPRKEWVILGVVLFLCAGVWIVGYALKTAQPPPSFQDKTADQWAADLKVPDVAARIKAVEALGRIGKKSDKTIPALQQAAIQDEHDWVRRLAYQALLEIDPASARAVPPQPLFNPRGKN